MPTRRRPYRRRGPPGPCGNIQNPAPCRELKDPATGISSMATRQSWPRCGVTLTLKENRKQMLSEAGPIIFYSQKFGGTALPEGPGISEEAHLRAAPIGEYEV